MKKFVILLFAFAAACSESSDDKRADDETPLAPTGAIFSHSFIQSFIVPDEFVAFMRENGITVRFDSREVNRLLNTDRVEFTRLCEKHNDLTYDRKVVPDAPRAVAETISAIDVVCDRDIDEQHPAGSSLNDMIRLYALSYKNFIESGYVATYPYSEEFKSFCYFPNGKPVCKMLDELAPDDLELSDSVFYLLFTKRLGEGSYRFTVIVTTESGTFTQTVETE